MSFSTAHLTTLDVVCVPLHDTLGARSGWGLRFTDKKGETQRPHCQWEAWGDWDGVPRRPRVEPRLFTTTLDSSLFPHPLSCPSCSSFPEEGLLREHSLSPSSPSLSHSYVCARTYICGPGHLLQHSMEESNDREMPKSLEGSPGPLLGDPVL